MQSQALSKQSLGMGYLVGAGVVLSLALLAHIASTLDTGVQAAVVAVGGLAPALALAGANYWLPRSGLDGEEVWTVAEWGGLGIGLLTMANVAILLSDISLVRFAPGLLASSIAIGGLVGILVGALLELRRSSRRLKQSNDVLHRVLRHDMRNDLNVAMGHLTALEGTVDGDAAAHVEDLRARIDKMATTTQKARQIDVALGADRRAQRPIDIVPHIEDRIAALQRAHPEAEVEFEAPPTALVYADWLIGSVLGNIVENSVIHSESAPHLRIDIAEHGATTEVCIVDSGPTIPEAELDVFTRGTETPLQHSKGVGLWLVTWVVESYGGEVRFDTADNGGNVVTLELRSASWLGERQWALPLLG